VASSISRWRQTAGIWAAGQAASARPISDIHYDLHVTKNSFHGGIN
jgi:hypothetical protein